MSSTEDLEQLLEVISKVFSNLIYVRDYEQISIKRFEEGITFQPKKFSAEHYPKLYLKQNEKRLLFSILFDTRKNLISFKKYLFEGDVSQLMHLLKKLNDDSYTKLCAIKELNNQQHINELRYYKSNKIDLLTIKRLIAVFDGLMDLIDSNMSGFDKIYFHFTESILHTDVEIIENKLMRIKEIYSFLLDIKPILSEEEERINYAYFVKILNEVRRTNLISAKQRRNYEHKWRNNMHLRIEIMEELKRKLNNQ